MAENKKVEYDLASPEAKVGEINKALKTVEKRQTAVMEIKTDQDYAEATAVAVDVKSHIKRLKALKVEYVKPLKDAVKQVEGLFSAPLKSYEEIESKIKRAMSDFAAAQEREARAKEEKARKAREAREEKAGKKMATPLPTAERAEPTVRVAGGKTTKKKVWKFRITDPAKVPAEYLMVDEKKIGGVVRAGIREIEGVEIYEDIEISVTA